MTPPPKIEPSNLFSPKQNPTAIHRPPLIPISIHQRIAPSPAKKPLYNRLFGTIDTYFDFPSGLKKWSRLGYGNEDCILTHSLANLWSSFPVIAKAQQRSSSRQAGAKSRLKIY
ncbi:Hypothetical predicted protein [Olea europaea subsp. europaea]|uniref:Uncharacterized protein n=1 Tax=Olea europaea subsp. europaea TaxID=158383 RepID=A0A8S0PXK8_OLEEU|nr:Hypothetical predicted protein [Olea europaea subsp. europaea]